MSDDPAPTGPGLRPGPRQAPTRAGWGRRLWSLVLLGAAPLLPARDFLVWPDGDRLGGTYLGTRDGRIEFQSDRAGLLQVPEGQARVERGSPAPAPDPVAPAAGPSGSAAAPVASPAAIDASPSVSEPTLGLGSMVGVVPTDHADEPAPAVSPGPPAETPPPGPWSAVWGRWRRFWKEWKGRATAGLDIKTDERERVDFFVEVRADRTRPHRDERLEFRYEQRYTDQVVTTDRVTSLYRFHRFWSERWFFFGESRYEQEDVKEHLRTLNQELGPGYRWLSTERFDLRTTVGTFIVYFVPEGGASTFEIYPGALLEGKFRLPLDLSLTHESRLLAPGTGTIDYAVELVSELEHKFSRALSLVLRHEWRAQRFVGEDLTDDFNRIRFLFRYNF